MPPKRPPGDPGTPRPVTPETPESEPEVVLDLRTEFDVYLQEINPASTAKTTEKAVTNGENPAEGDKSQDVEKPTVVSSELIRYDSLKDRAKRWGVAVPDLYLRLLRSGFADSLVGFFCLPSDLTKIDNSLTLSQYAKLVPSAASGKEHKLTVTWTRNASIDVGKVLNDIPDPDKLSPSNQKPLEKDVPTLPPYISIFDTKQGIAMDKPTDSDTVYKLQPEDWSRIIVGNELLHAFRRDQKQIDLLKSTSLSNMFGPGFKSGNTVGTMLGGITISSIGGADVTSALAISPIIPIPRSTRPLFALHPRSSVLGSDKTGDALDSGSIDVAPGPFWSNAKAVATTQIIKTQSSTAHWSLVSGMSRDSVSAGLALPLGKVTVGGKFGYQNEVSYASRESVGSSETHLSAIHNIPCAQININETTVMLTPEAEYDIKKLRRERRFADLISFTEKFGSIVFENITLGGRLYHTQDFTEVTAKADYQEAERLKVSANASLGIADVLKVEGGGSKETSSTNEGGSAFSYNTENLTWSGIGGNASLSVDPPRWRDSLNNYSYWKAIHFDNPVRIDEFINKLPGYGDVSTLFSDVISTGVLSPEIIAIPPTGLGAGTLQVGAAIQASTGEITDDGLEGIAEEDLTVSSAGPESYSWNILRTSRDVKREIWASLQATLNPMIRKSFEPPFLRDLRGSATTFCIVLRWTSQAITKSSWLSTVSRIWKRGEHNKSDDDATDAWNGKFLLWSLTSRAWVTGIWQFKQAELETEFEELKSRLSAYFSEPRSIEGGCDYITSESAAKTGKPTPAYVKFFLYASDGVGKEDKQIVNSGLPANAFDAISTRINMSSIHFLPFKGEIGTFPHQVFPSSFVDSEATLMLEQQARAENAFQGAQG